MGKKFVIMEVRHVKGHHSYSLDKWEPVENNTNKTTDAQECLYLHPSSIIDGDRLRYGYVKRGETYFSQPDTIFGWKECNSAIDHCGRLILDPPPEEKSDLDKAMSSAPSCIGSEARKWIQQTLIPAIKEELNDKT